MFNPSTLNSKFKLFQRKTKRFSGLSHSDVLPLNIYFCKSNSNFYLSTRHIELMTRYLKRKLKKSGVLVFPTPAVYPITKKPTEVRMGKGKGGITDWTIPTKKGGVPFFFQGKKTRILKTSLKDILKKLPIRSKIVESKHKLSQLNSINSFFNTTKFTNNNATTPKINI